MTVADLGDRMSYQEFGSWASFYRWRAAKRGQAERKAGRRRGRR